MDNDLNIKKTVLVRTWSNRRYTVDRHGGKPGKPDYYELTEHRKDGRRFKVFIPQPDMQRVIAALQEAQKQ